MQEPVRKWLFNKGFRYRKNVTALPGKPDLVLPKYGAVIFVHGCFWHGHAGCRYFVVPKTRTEWWMEKINRNEKNDEDTRAALVAAGWTVLVVWECEIRRKVEAEVKLQKLAAELRSLIAANERNTK